MIVRPYRPADREAVRAICHQTGYMGATAEWFWRDRASFADLFTGYYTDVEPESAQVVVAERADGAPPGTVVGYLLGALDAARVPGVAEVLLPHVLGRLVAFRPGTAGVVWRGLLDVAAEVAGGRGIPEDRYSDPRYPSHFHLDLLPPARGHGVGQRLVGSWLESLRSAGSPGCHLETLAENAGAVAFFGRMGFEPVGPLRIAPGWRHREGGPLHIQVMARSL
jgi:ribosomal protein S18 acetylase RimI-like enzyme